MDQLKRSELNTLIGKNSFFSSPKNVRNELYYVSGLPCFDTYSKSGKKIPLALIAHPLGIEITNSGQGISTGIRFDEIEGYVVDNDETGFFLDLKLNQNKTVFFRFYGEYQSDVLKFLRNVNVKQLVISTRTEEEANSAILALQTSYVQPPNYTALITKLVKTTIYGTKKELKITNDIIQWGDATLDVKHCTGFCYGKTETRFSGIKTAMQYTISVHSRGNEPLKIAFTMAFGMSETEADSLYSTIIDAFFNLIAIPQINGWLHELAHNRIVELDDSALRREGIIVRKEKPDVYIRWQDVSVKQFQLSYSFYSKFDKKLAIGGSIQHSPEVNALVQFVTWLSEDQRRLIALIG
ncbi:MAG: hypothetical protein QNK23_10730 [Crocinitomicaceae bacterium]|nr:hypothetical protein [Crocinitomicaceae bacterium]